MTYVISGASGQLGRVIADELAKRVPASELILVTRNPAALADWADRGAKVVAGDYRDKKSLLDAYQGGMTLMLISGLAIGERVAEHRNAIEAAKAVGIKHITYTSVGGVHPTSPVPSTADHVGTERLLWSSGLSFAALRSHMYSEIFYVWLRRQALPVGRWLQVGEKGRLAPVSRRDIAACAATIMTNHDQHDRVTYEITGPELMTFPEISALGSRLFGVPIEYVPITPEQMYADFDAAGVPRKGDPASTIPPVLYGSHELVQQYIAYEQGYQDILSHHVEFLTGKPPRRLEDVLKEQIAQGSGKP
jgi:NAD(P)H dehydrogenase (quinone)